MFCVTICGSSQWSACSSSIILKLGIAIHCGLAGANSRQFGLDCDDMIIMNCNCMSEVVTDDNRV
jgi:hypothetical protein